MSTQVLYHGFRIRGYQHVRMENIGGELHFTVAQRREQWRCSHCGGSDVISRGQVPRQFRCPPIGRRSVCVHLMVPRVECRMCGKTRQGNSHKEIYPRK